MASESESAISKKATQLFLVATKYSIGMGDLVSFWHNRSIEGPNPFDIAPNLYPFIKARGWKKRIAAEALAGNQWTNDICGILVVSPTSAFREQ